MKLPPAALTAPSICPRCDSPAIMTDYCIACTLPLRRCGSCQGVAGPFDHYCGFCGYELVRGERRLPVWRLWLLAALIPLVAGIAFGVSPYGAELSRGVGTLVGPATPAPPAATPAARDANLALGYTAPTGWTASARGPLLVIAGSAPDADKVEAAQGNLLVTPAQAGAIVVSRPPVDAPVDTSDPQAVLVFELGRLLQAPPAGVRLETARPVGKLSVGGRPAAEAVLRVTRQDGSAWYFERAYLAGSKGLVRVDALVPAADWSAGDEQRVEAAIRSIRG